MRKREVSDEEERGVCWEMTRTSDFYSAKPPNQRAVLSPLEESLQRPLTPSWGKKTRSLPCRNRLPVAAHRARSALAPRAPPHPHRRGSPARTPDAHPGAPAPSLASTPAGVAACPHFLGSAGGSMNYRRLTYEPQLFSISTVLSQRLSQF